MTRRKFNREFKREAVHLVMLRGVSVAQAARGCCQSNANPSPFINRQQVLGSEKFAPFEKCGIALSFESLATVDVAI